MWNFFSAILTYQKNFDSIQVKVTIVYWVFIQFLFCFVEGKELYASTAQEKAI